MSSEFEPEPVNCGAEAEVRELEAPGTEPEPEYADQLNKSNLQSLLLSSDLLMVDGEFNCKVCGETGFTLAQLARHMQFHDHDRPFPCQICGKRFLSRSHHMEHQRVHTGARPFPCDRCQRAFTTHHNLKRHQLIHSKEEASRCTVCGVLFCQEHQQGNIRDIMRVLKQHHMDELIGPDPHVDPEPPEEASTKFRLQTVNKGEQRKKKQQRHLLSDEDTFPFAEREENYTEPFFHPEVHQFHNSKGEFGDLVLRTGPKIQKIAYDIEIIL